MFVASIRDSGSRLALSTVMIGRGLAIFLSGAQMLPQILHEVEVSLVCRQILRKIEKYE